MIFILFYGKFFIRFSFKEILSYMLCSFLSSNSVLTNENTIINHYTKEGENKPYSILFNNNDSDNLKTKIIDKKLQYVIKNMVESQLLSKEKLVPFIEQMMDKLDIYS